MKNLDSTHFIKLNCVRVRQYKDFGFLSCLEWLEHKTIERILSLATESRLRILRMSCMFYVGNYYFWCNSILEKWTQHHSLKLNGIRVRQYKEFGILFCLEWLEYKFIAIWKLSLATESRLNMNAIVYLNTISRAKYIWCVCKSVLQKWTQQYPLKLNSVEYGSIQSLDFILASID